MRSSEGCACLKMLLWSGLTVTIAARDVVLKTDVNVMAELTFIASRAYADPFNEVTLDAIVLDPPCSYFTMPLA